MEGFVCLFLLRASFGETSTELESSLRREPTFQKFLPRNEVWGATAEIPYWLLVISQIGVVLLIGWKQIAHAERPIRRTTQNWIIVVVRNFSFYSLEIISQGNQWWNVDCFFRLQELPTDRGSSLVLNVSMLCLKWSINVYHGKLLSIRLLKKTKTKL